MFYLGVWLEKCIPGLRIAGVDNCAFDVKIFQVLKEECVTAAIQLGLHIKWTSIIFSPMLRLCWLVA